MMIIKHELKARNDGPAGMIATPLYWYTYSVSGTFFSVILF